MSWRSSQWTRGLQLMMIAAVAASVSAADDPAIARARQAIASGSVAPERDLAPLVEALRRARDTDDQRRLVEVISDLGSATGSSPVSARAYLLERSTPLLLGLARTGATNFLKGEAMFALRDMGAPRSVLEQAAAIAEADPDDFVKSRGEILRGFIAKMPAEAAASAPRATDPDQARAGLAYLRQHGLGVSVDQLGRSAQEGDAIAVKALLDAGVDPNVGAYTDLPLYRATFSGCSAHGGDTDGLVDTVSALLGAGADLKKTDDNGNTVLVSAAQMCGPRIVAALVAAGAKIDVRNKSGLSPLAMALLMQKIDSAELLVAKGARLNAQETSMLSASATDPRAKAVVAKAGTR